jgi:glutaminyl-peptide cyclotransferase
MKYAFIVFVCLFAACKNDSGDENTDNSNLNPAPPSINYSIVNVFPHDTSSFTEGLLLHNNSLYESTGLEGQSYLMKVDLKTGKAQKKTALDKNLFGEGITILKDKIFMLTYQNNKAFSFDLNTFEKLQEFEWPYEGWGMTHNGSSLIISTGGSNLYFVEPNSFKIQKMVGVTDNNGPVGNINELEYVDGLIYANVWQTNYIVKIDPETGKILGKLDLTDILAKNNIAYDPNHLEFLNGIAYNASSKTFYITGKWWPALFEVKLN